MTRSRGDIAVLGMGLITALGSDAETNWASLRAGRSGARLIDSFETDGLPTRFAAHVSDPRVDGRMPWRRMRQMATLVLDEAMRDAGLTPEDLRGRPARMFLATPHNEVLVTDRITVAAGEDDALGRQLLRGAFSTQLARELMSEFGIGGAPVTVTTACASAASAIQLAGDALRRGEIEVAVVVTSDATVNPEGLVRFSLLSALSSRNDSPETASRPFTASRDGFVMGEGAAALILRRDPGPGTRVRGYVRGYGDATDNFHRTRSHPSGRAITKCLAAALADAGVGPEAIGYINAHGTSTPENDKMEALGIREVFGAKAALTPVSSSKSMIGHTLSAAGGVEAVVTLLALERGFLPPTINHLDPDPDIALDVIPNVGRESNAALAMSNSFGFGGQNVSLILERPRL